MQQITFDILYDWLRGYQPKCTCGASVHVPQKVKDPEGLGREIYLTRCTKAHTLFFEIIGEIKDGH